MTRSRMFSQHPRCRRMPASPFTWLAVSHLQCSPWVAGQGLRADLIFCATHSAHTLAPPAAGNHDHYGNISAQVAYSELNARWVFPSYYYTWTKPVDSRTTIQFVYIDTVVLSGNSDVHHPTTHELIRELHGSELPGPADQSMADAQLEWLSQTLAASTADYLIVAGHYPVYSVCEHGPTPDLVKRVKPLLEAHHVTAYLNGHDHCEQHLQERTGGVDYHTVGSAAINDASTAHAADVPPGSLKFHSPGTLGGFASVTVTKYGLTLTHHDGNGEVLYAAPAHAPRDAAWLAAAAARLRPEDDRR